MEAERLRRGRLPESAARDFPDALEFEQQRMALVYRFDPGSDDDGVTLEIPVELVPRVRIEPFEWLVPGLLADKVLAMLKLLPKAKRRELLPLTDCAREFLQEGTLESGSLANALREFLRSRRGVEVPEDAWQRARLEAKLEPFQPARGRGHLLAVGGVGVLAQPAQRIAAHVTAGGLLPLEHQLVVPEPRLGELLRIPGEFLVEKALCRDASLHGRLEYLL